MRKGMHERQILAVIKEVGEKPRIEPLFDNTLEAFQEAVGGNIETVTLSEKVVLIVNEEGRLLGLPHNVCLGNEGLCGTVIAVGVEQDEFASLPGMVVSAVMHWLDQ